MTDRRSWGVKFPKPARAMSANDVPVTRKGRIIEGKIKKRWREAAEAAAADLGLLPPCEVTVIIPFEQNRRRDPHNYVATVVKPVIDGLVRAGVWVDDTPEYVTVREPVLVVGDEVHVRLDERLVELSDDGNT